MLSIWLNSPAFWPVVRCLAVLVGAWVVTYPGGWLVARAMGGKRKQLLAATKSEEHQIHRPSRGFDDGGAVIGRWERLLIYLLVMAGQPGAVGFLIAAKSIFRFGELSDHQNRLEAEYITIGTMASFAVGFAISLGVECLLVGLA